MDFIGDSVLIAHNVDFDYPFLSHALKKSLGKTLNNDSYCTLGPGQSKDARTKSSIGGGSGGVGNRTKELAPGFRGCQSRRNDISPFHGGR